MKNFYIALSAVALAIPIATGPTEAAPEVGQWTLGTQQICLQEDGTWFSTTFPDWRGFYTVSEPRVFIRGNYAGGDGNDAVVAEAPDESTTVLVGVWQEWRNDFSFDNVLEPTTLEFVKADCDPKAFGDAYGGNPLDAFAHLARE